MKFLQIAHLRLRVNRENDNVHIFYLLQDNPDYDPVDNCLSSVLGQEVELTDEFKVNYEKWLNREVYNMEIEWELLLENPPPDLVPNREQPQQEQPSNSPAPVAAAS